VILTITGFHGTGKSTIGKLIAESLGITYYSTGEAFRELAKEKEMTLAEFTEFVENHPDVDLELDEKIIQVAKKDNIIIDSQLSGFLLKDIADFKIHLVCPIDIRVKRMAGRDQTSYKAKLKETTLREESELERFKKLYNIDLNNIKEVNETFDLIINTENLTIEEVLKLILLKLKEYY